MEIVDGNRRWKPYRETVNRKIKFYSFFIEAPFYFKKIRRTIYHHKKLLSREKFTI